MRQSIISDEFFNYTLRWIVRCSMCPNVQSCTSYFKYSAMRWPCSTFVIEMLDVDLNEIVGYNKTVNRSFATQNSYHISLNLKRVMCIQNIRRHRLGNFSGTSSSSTIEYRWQLTGGQCVICIRNIAYCQWTTTKWLFIKASSLCSFRQVKIIQITLFLNSSTACEGRG